MATTSTWRRWSGVARLAVVAGALAATVLVVLAGPASAHKPRVKAGCEDGTTTLKVELVRYNSSHPNTVKVTNGDTVLVDTTFGSEYKKSWEFPGNVGHTFVVTVHAWDDPDGSKGFSINKTLRVAACVVPTTTVEPTTTIGTTTSGTTTEPTTTTTGAAPTTTTAAGGGGSGDLPETGVSLAVPLVLGALLLAGGGALLVLVRKRGTA